MAIPVAEKLLSRARDGEQLASKERRHCINYLTIKEPSLTNVALGELFQVSEKQIRLDKQKIRKDRADLLKEDDIGLVIADIAIDLENQIRDIEVSKRKCKLGTNAFLKHCVAAHKMRLDTVHALQDLGYYPKNLGNMTVSKFEYRAIVSKDGSVDTQPVMENDNIIDAEVIETKAIAAPEEAIDLDARGVEFDRD
jgi:hypothetical protein